MDTSAVDRPSPRPLSGLHVTPGGVVCLAASAAGSVVAASEQTFQIAGSPVTVAGHVLAAKLPLPANSKIVTLNVPSTQGGREHECHPLWQAQWAAIAKMDGKTVLWKA